ncbi:MAG: flagellar hook-length control protein FliK [Treponema sp.]
MQGLNLNFDSTYIQNSIQESKSPQNMELAKGSVSFLEMLKNEIKINDSSNAKSVSEENIEKPVISDSSESEETQKVKVASSNSDSGQQEKTFGTTDDENSYTEQKAIDCENDFKEKHSVLAEVSSENEEENLLRLVNKKRKVSAESSFCSDEKVIAEEKFFVSQADIEALNELPDDAKIKIQLDENTEIKVFKTETSDEELIAAQLSSSENPGLFLQTLEKQLKQPDEKENIENSIKPVKEKKSFSDVFTVTDLRTQKNPQVQLEKKADFVTSVKQTDSNSVQVTMDLTAQAEKNILSLDSQSAGAQGSAFQAMLEKQISENASDFVKAGNIVLKDNNAGKINLILHPENLGNVKISLELSDKVITGKIIVSSQEAYKAFNATSENLKSAFIESGFDGASFDVSFAGQNQNFAGSGQNENHNAQYVQAAYDNFVVENISVDENNSDIINDVRDYSINIVA